MIRLPQTTLHFNRQPKLSNDGGELSSDTGQFLFREFDEKFGFSRTIAKHHIHKWKYHTISSEITSTNYTRQTYKRRGILI